MDDNVLVKLFAISTLGLIAQSIISRRSRRMLMRSLVLMFYCICVALSGGTLSVLFFKLLKRKQRLEQERR